MSKCGDCLHFHQCSHYVTAEETFPEVGGCSAFKNKGDFVEVVRCKNCVHRKEKVCFNPSAGMWVGVELKDSDFCSYGERRDNV